MELNQERAHVERFAIEGSLRGFSIVGGVFFTVMACASVALPFLPDGGKPKNPNLFLGVSIAGVVVFGALAYMSIWLMRRIPRSAVSLDEEGIWKTESPRDSGFVPWSQIVQIRERNGWQKLDLLDRVGTLRMEIEYQLGDFARLRDIIMQRAALPPWTNTSVSIFAKPPRYHFYYFLTVLGLVAVGGVGWKYDFRAGAAYFAAIHVVWVYLTTVCRLQLTATNLIVSWPLRRLPLNRKEVIAVELNDLIVPHGRHPRVKLTLAKRRKALDVRSLGIPAVELKQRLDAWLASAN